MSGPLKLLGPSGVWMVRHYWLIGNTLHCSKSDNFDEVYQQIHITHETKIKLNERESVPQITIRQGDATYVLSSADILSWAIAFRACKRTDKTLSMDQFRVVSVLGHGFYGKVLLVEKNGTGQLFAIKTIRKKKLRELDQTSTIEAERTLLGSLKHPFIISLKFAFQTDFKFYLGLEYAAGGELLEFLSKMTMITIDTTKLYIAEIVLALEYIHKHHIIYRDLKPENVLVDESGHVKLTDFGISKQLEDITGTGTFCGTPEYMAPEIVKHHEYDYKVDIWALGILFCEMLQGSTPFADEKGRNDVVLNNIVNAEPNLSGIGHRSAAQLIRKLLAKDPKERPTIDEIKADRFFSRMDWDKVLRKEIPIKNFGGLDPERLFSDGNDEEPKDSVLSSKERVSWQLSNFSCSSDH